MDAIKRYKIFVTVLSLLLVVGSAILLLSWVLTRHDNPVDSLPNETFKLMIKNTGSDTEEPIFDISGLEYKNIEIKEGYEYSIEIASDFEMIESAFFIVENKEGIKMKGECDPSCGDGLLMDLSDLDPGTYQLSVCIRHNNSHSFY